MKTKKEYNPKLLILFALPLFLNFLVNVFTGEISPRFSLVAFYMFISTMLYVVFYFYLGYLIKKILKLENISYGVVIYFLSFFIIDNTFLFITKNITFRNLHLAVSILWILLLIIRMRFSKEIFILIGLKLLLILYNFFILLRIPLTFEFDGDVKSMWLPWVESIHTNNSFYLMSNSSREGAGILISHVQSTIFNEGFPFSDYFFVPPTSYFLFFLGILFLFELKIHRNINIFLIIIFSLLILNSEWLNYLFASSLMSEGVLSILFCIIFINFLDINNSDSSKSNVLFSFLLLSHLFHTKFFINIIVYLIIFTLAFYKKEILGISISLFTLILNEINYRFLLPGISRNELLQEVNISTLTESGITGLEYSNIIKIFNHIFTDKPMVYLIVLGCALHIINLKLNRLSLSSNISATLLIVNLIFVILLYIAIWKDVEYESAYRYILNLFHLILFWLGVNLDNLFNKKR